MKKKKAKKRIAKSSPKKSGFECYHCQRVIPEKNRKTHNCWSTTEDALTANLSDELLDAWKKLREAALDFGEQRVYANFRSIMFARKHCYFFVRPTPKRLELVFFLRRTMQHPTIKKAQSTTMKNKKPKPDAKVGHMVHIIHEDQIESPLTDWLRESYEMTLP